MTKSEIWYNAIMKVHKVNPKWFPEGMADGCFINKNMSFEDNCRSILLTHKFAYCFWDCGHLTVMSHGSNKLAWQFKTIKGQMTTTRQPAWMYHLQQLVLEKHPLRYIEKFL